jgi:hypothetical protein
MSQGNDMKGSTLREVSVEGDALAADDDGDCVADVVDSEAAGDVDDDEGDGEEPMNLCAGNAGNLCSSGRTDDKSVALIRSLAASRSK